MRTICKQVAWPLGLALVVALSAHGSSAFAGQLKKPPPRVVRAVPVPAGLSGRMAVTAPSGIPSNAIDRLHQIGAYRIQQIGKDLVLCQLGRGAQSRINEAIPGAAVMSVSDLIASGSAPPGLHPMLRQFVDPVQPLEDLPPSNAVPPPPDYVPEPLRPEAVPAGGAVGPVCHNSEMMVGDLLVHIVFVENPNNWGNRNQWTEGQILQVQYEISEAFRKFQDASPVDISVIFRSHKRVPVRVDPIRYNRFATSWVHDAMTALGVASYNEPIKTRVEIFNNVSRAAWQTDWVTTLFVVNAVHDWDRDYLFADARVPAFGHLGGPYAVTPYPAGWLGFQGGVERSLMPKIGALFWCVDEQAQPIPDCDTRSGYLGYINGNKTKDIILPQLWRTNCGYGAITDCVMNLFDTWTLLYPLEICKYSRGMLGFSDDNENGAPDALDIAPRVEFAGALAETLTTQPGKQVIQVIAEALPNMNEQQDPAQRRRYAPPIYAVDVAIAGLSPYRVVNEELRENIWEVELPMPVLIPGFSEVTVSGLNTFKTASEPLTKRITYVDLRFTQIATTHLGDDIRIDWTMMGELFGATFRVARHNLQTGEVVFVSDVARNLGSAHGFTDFSMVDSETETGADYEYSVHGRIEIPHRGGTLRVERESVESEIRGAVARSEQADRLRVAPNPFRDQVWVTVDVPAVVGPQTTAPNQSAVPEPARLSAAVYAVDGSRVVELQPHLDRDAVATFSWNGLDRNGRRVAAGVYFVGVRVGDAMRTRKVLLLR